MTFELLWHAAFAADEIWGIMLEPARINDQNQIWCANIGECMFASVYELVQAYHPKFRQPRMPDAIATRASHTRYWVHHVDRHEQWKRVTLCQFFSLTI